MEDKTSDNANLIKELQEELEIQRAISVALMKSESKLQAENKRLKEQLENKNQYIKSLKEDIGALYRELAKKGLVD